MHILFLSQTLGYGGAAKIVTFLANKMVDTNKVTILFYEQKEIRRPLDERINAIFVPLFGTGIKIRLKRFKCLKRQIKQVNPDIIISFLTAPNFYATIIGRVLHIPVIISERGDPTLFMSFRAKMHRCIFNLASGAVFQTEGAKECYPKKLQLKSAVIPNPVPKDSHIIHDASLSNHIISFVSRFDVYQKRHDIMLKAMKNIVENYSDALLRFYGDGKDELSIRNMTEELKLSNNVEFMGYTAHVKEVMDESEVFCLTSDFEGIPNTLIEAMSIGMPVVSTDCTPGGARMLIQDGINGLLVERRNAEQIAEAVCRLFANDELRICLGKEAAKIVDTFSEELILKKWIDYLKKMVKN